MSPRIPPRPSRARGRLATALRLLAAGCLAALAGCDYVGLQSVSQIEARKEAEGRAIGGACRQAGRALEDCYAFNPHMSKAAVFAGWREMNDYMMQNNLSVVRPEVTPVLPGSRARADAGRAPADLPLDGMAKPPARATTAYSGQ